MRKQLRRRITMKGNILARRKNNVKNTVVLVWDTFFLRENTLQAKYVSRIKNTWKKKIDYREKNTLQEKNMLQERRL